MFLSNLTVYLQNLLNAKILRECRRTSYPQKVLCTTLFVLPLQCSIFSHSHTLPPGRTIGILRTRWVLFSRAEFLVRVFLFSSNMGRGDGGTVPPPTPSNLVPMILKKKRFFKWFTLSQHWMLMWILKQKIICWNFHLHVRRLVPWTVPGHGHLPCLCVSSTTNYNAGPRFHVKLPTGQVQNLWVVLLISILNVHYPFQCLIGNAAQLSTKTKQGSYVSCAAS